jgi:hypothetical protein
MEKNNLDFDLQDSISTEKQEAGVGFEFVRLTARVTGGWRDETRPRNGQIPKG